MKTRLTGLETKVVCVAVALVWSAVGCKKDDETRAPSTVSVGPGAGGGAGEGGGSGGSGGGVIEDTPCETAANPSVEVYPAGSELGLQYLAKSGTRFMASGHLGYVGFDENGENADVLPPVQVAGALNVASDEGDTIGISSGGENAVAYQRFDAAGEVFGRRVLANEPPNAVTSALAGDDAVVVWGWNGKLAARVMDAAGTLPAEAFDVVPGAYNGSLQLSAVSKGNEVSLAWFGAASVSANQSWFLRLDATGPLSEPYMFHETGGRHELRQIVSTDEGHVVLITGEPPESRPELLVLNDSGVVRDSAVGLTGAVLGYGVASQNDAIAVVAGRETGEPQLRVFDLSLEPLGPWVCLGADHEPSIPAAITVDGSGYAVIYQADNGALMLNRVDSVGTGAP